MGCVMHGGAMGWDPRIVLMGVGGAGCNFLDVLLPHPAIELLECVAVNTDAEALARSRAPTKLQLGAGLGAGAKVSAGREAAKASRRSIRNALKHRHFLILLAGLGGGTGTGATPVIAKIARKMGIPAIAIVTRPFSFEHRERAARKGLKRIGRNTEAVITVSNDDICASCCADVAFDYAFGLIDKEVINLVRCFTSTVLEPNSINQDLPKVLDWVRGAGELAALNLKGTGESALQEVLASVQAEDGIVAHHVKDAHRVFVMITESSAPTMRSIRKIIRSVQQHARPDAFFMYATASEPDLGPNLRLTLVTSGMKTSGH